MRFLLIHWFRVNTEARSSYTDKFGIQQIQLDQNQKHSISMGFSSFPLQPVQSEITYLHLLENANIKLFWYIGIKISHYKTYGK